MGSPKKDFEDLFACLNSHGARFLVVGGYAVAYHAKPRFTKDIDVFVEATPENAARVLMALEDFGFGGLGLSTADFSEPSRIVQMGAIPNRVDLITSIDAVSFAEAWATRAPGKYGEQPVFYIGKAELIRNKEAVGRPQDLLDVSWLKDAE